MTMETTITKTENNLPAQSESSPLSLIQIAIERNLPIEHLEKLMALKERYDAIEAKKKFLEAMSNFQSDCPPLEKSKEVKFGSTKYSYAPLGEITATIKEPIKKNDLSFRWSIDDQSEKIICTCIISHISGHSEQTTMSAGKDTSGSKNEIQSRGSTITYLQRYTLIAALGISTADEDTDTSEATPEQYRYIEGLKHTCSLPQEKLDALEIKLSAGLTYLAAEACIAYLKDNQRDNISHGGNYSQTDIQNKIKQQM